MRDDSFLRLVPGGAFVMGSPEGVGHDDEHPAHEVSLEAFYMDECPVTAGSFSRFCSESGMELPAQPAWSAPDHPIVNVTHAEAAAYAAWTGKRLPTEAEWEKAARGDSKARYPFGEDEGLLRDYAWFRDNSDGKTHPVASLSPGPYGLLDMLGNVWEWVADWYGGAYYAKSPERDPRGPDSGDTRVLRGGSWTTFDLLCRPGARNCLPEGMRGRNLGFRCAIDAVKAWAGGVPATGGA